MVEVQDSLSSIFQSVEKLGVQGESKEVVVGGFAFLLSPLSSSTEVDIYTLVEEEFLLPPDTLRQDSPTLRMGPAYVLRVKEEIIIHAISSINGFHLDPTQEIVDASGQKREALSYFRSIVRGWSPEVINLMHIKYNQMLGEVAKKLGYEMPHQTFITVLEKLLQAQSQAFSKTPAGLDQTEDVRAEDLEDLPEGLEEGDEGVGERPLQAVEDPASTGVLES